MGGLSLAFSGPRPREPRRAMAAAGRRPARQGAGSLGTPIGRPMRL